MASANDRKISQLPVAGVTEDTTNFIVVSGIGTTPVNERITTQTLFNNVPVSLVVGQEFAGKNVIFNATDDPTNRFTFTHDNGDVSIGSNAAVNKNLTVGGDLVVSGTTTFANTNFIQLSVSGATTFNDTVVFHKQIQTNDRLTVSNDGSIGGNFYVTQNTNLNTLTVGGGTNLNNVLANNISLASVTATNYITVQDLDVTDITVSGNTNVDVVEATGLIRTTENIHAQVGVFDALSVKSHSVFHNKLTAQELETDLITISSNLQTQTATVKGELVVQDNVTAANNVIVTNDIQSTKVSATEGIFTELVFENPRFTQFLPDGTLPASSTLPVGSVRLYSSGTTNYLMINTPTGWQGIGLLTVAGV